MGQQGSSAGRYCFIFLQDLISLSVTCKHFSQGKNKRWSVSWGTFKTSLSHYAAKLLHSSLGKKKNPLNLNRCCPTLAWKTGGFSRLTLAKPEPETVLQRVPAAFMFLQMVSYFGNAVNQKTLLLCMFLWTSAHLTAALTLLLRPLQTSDLLLTFFQYALGYFNYFIWY